MKKLVSLWVKALFRLLRHGPMELPMDQAVILCIPFIPVAIVIYIVTMLK